MNRKLKQSAFWGARALCLVASLTACGVSLQNNGVPYGGITDDPFHDSDEMGRLPLALPVAAPTRVVEFVLYNADTDLPIRTLQPGETLSLQQLGTRNLNIRAITYPEVVGSVIFYIDGNQKRLQESEPYTLGGDSGADYKAYSLPRGEHAYKAVPFADLEGQGAVGIALEIDLNVID
jgi:hypothetical protein